MKLSRISSKGQVTIPKAVREFLGVNPGDLIMYVVQNEKVVLRPVRSVGEIAEDSLCATLTEWHSVQDDEVFRDL